MLRSMYSGISGMKGFQTKLDVIGNNIANVNTVGFKKSRVMFQDLLSQNLAGATPPTVGLQGGTNVKQVGLGQTVSSIDKIHSAGSVATTGVATDLAIEGDGFFLIAPANGDLSNPLYTRAGNFTLDANGSLVTSQGNAVLGEHPDGTVGAIAVDASIYNGFNIGRNGEVFGHRSDTGATEVIATLSLGFVQNPAGLRAVGGSAYEMTNNANPNGDHFISTIDNAGGRKVQINAGQLEMSNVDLTEEFSEMIVAQRGFQSNSRIITTSDEILQEVVNLKR